MTWHLQQKTIKDIKPGDLTLDADGKVSRVLSKTEEHRPDDLYELTFVTKNKTMTILADGQHVWPIDPNRGGIPYEAKGESEATTEDLAVWSTRGLHPSLTITSTATGGPSRPWMLKSCILTDDSTQASTRVACLSVNSPSHTFMLASQSAVKQPSTTTTVLVTANDGSSYEISRDDYDRAMNDALPTHNCGGPLPLSTIIPLADGTTTTMGTIATGDVVISPSGPSPVLSTSPIMPAKKLYHIDVVDDDSEEDLPQWTIDDLRQAEARYQAQHQFDS
jgi:hypothetical protein